jgi:hypothetical protein
MYSYWLTVDLGRGMAQKVGQFPLRSIRTRREVSRLLDPESPGLYSKGVMAEALSLGTGSFAHCRRVLEAATSFLLDRIVNELMSPDDLERHADAIAEIRNEHSATERRKLAAKISPANLRPCGRNPLGILGPERDLPGPGQPARERLRPRHQPFGAPLDDHQHMVDLLCHRPAGDRGRALGDRHLALGEPAADFVELNPQSADLAHSIRSGRSYRAVFGRTKEDGQKAGTILKDWSRTTARSCRPRIRL